MGKKSKQLNEEQELINSEEQPILNELALGISKSSDGSWGVVEIAFNSDTGDSDIIDIHSAGVSRDDAIELFKITAVERGIV